MSSSSPPPTTPFGGRSLSLSSLAHAGLLAGAAILLGAGLERPRAVGEPVVLANAALFQVTAHEPLPDPVEPQPALAPEDPPLDATPTPTPEQEPPLPEDEGFEPVHAPEVPPGWPWDERTLPEEIVEEPEDIDPVESPAEVIEVRAQPPPATDPGDRGPELLVRTRPAYPRAAVRMGQEGAVHLRIHVAADGSVADVELVSSSGHRRLDGAALEAVRSWTFSPAVRGGAVHAATLLHTVRFRLAEPD